jgi:DNA-binding HxlR family transcriptional regulator
MHCSILATLDTIGDRWSILVLRELFYGVRRFNDMQSELGISRSVLTERLARLVDVGVVRAVPYQEPGERVRHEYRLTRKGVALLPVMISLMEWGDEYLNGGDGPISLEHRETGKGVRLELRTDDGPIEPNQIVPRLRRRGTSAVAAS